MAMETVFLPQDPFYYACREFYSLGCDYFIPQENKDIIGNNSRVNLDQSLHGNWESSSSSIVMQNVKEWDPNSSPEAAYSGGQLLRGGSPVVEASPVLTATGRRKRRRSRSSKNKEEMESQRMTHIAVERNRRRQMNEYLAVIRSLMPSSYVQRGDQASIIGGAINFVKELEQKLQTLEAQKRTAQEEKTNNGCSLSPVFADFFTFPQYSLTRTSTPSSGLPGIGNDQRIVENPPAALGDIEVTMVESHANLKIFSKKRPKQLMKIVAGLQCMWLTMLHINVTTVDEMVFYTISLKVEEGSQLNTVEEIADAVNHLLGRIQEEAVLS